MSQEIMCILKIETCPSLSGRSILTYNVGCNNHKDIYLRLSENSGKGNFNKEWICLNPLVNSKEKTFSSGSMRKLFRGKSVNTASFIMAVLKAEGLIEESEEDHSYRRIDPSGFMEGILSLMGSKSETLPSCEGKTVKVKKATTMKSD